jgi:hypothetical protein
VKLCVPPEHEPWIREYGCPVIPFGTNVKEMIKKGGEKASGPATRPSIKTMQKEIARQIEALPEIIEGSDLLVGVGLVQGAHTAAEKMKIPYRFMAFYPGIMGPPKDAPFPGRLVWGFGKWATNATIRGLINQKRKPIGLKPIADVWADWMGENVILASEKALVPVSDNIDFRFTQTGYMFLPPLAPLSREVEKFLAEGPPPVFIGFGSNPVHDPLQYGRMMAGVAKSTGRRLMVSRGWGAIDSAEESGNCLFVDEVPYDLLFPKIAMAIHHGGIGTMAAAAKAGIPQSGFPFMADQFMNQKELVKLGLSPQTTSFRKLSAEWLSRVISQGLADARYRENAQRIAVKINDHDGTGLTARLILSMV